LICQQVSIFSVGWKNKSSKALPLLLKTAGQGERYWIPCFGVQNSHAPQMHGCYV